MLKRPLFCVAVSFVAGMYILSFLNIDNVLLAASGIALVLLIMIIRRFNIKRASLLLLCVLMFCLGSIKYYTSNDIEAKALYNVVGDEIFVKAEIISEPIADSGRISFVANVTSAENECLIYHLDEKVLFSYYAYESPIDINNTPKLGDLISVPGKIRIPDGPMNTGGFDYAKYLKTDKIFFICDMEYNELCVEGHKNHTVSHGIAKFRNKCIAYIDDIFPGEEASVLKAFVVGEKSGIDTNVNDAFSASGLSHVLAISGLHVTTFISIVAAILKVLRVSKRKSMLISSIGAVAFVVFTGMSISAMRAGVLCVFGFAAKLLYRKSDSLTTLAIAAAVFSLENPLCIWDVSFMLSFAATAGIILFHNDISTIFLKFYNKFENNTYRYKVIKGVFDILSVGIAAQIFVIPILVYIFRGFSIMSVIATVVVSPFLGALLCGGLMFILLSFISGTVAYPIAGFAFALTKFLIAVAEFFASFKFSEIMFGSITPFLILMYGLFIGIFLSLIKKHKPTYVVSVVSFAILSLIGLWNFQSNYDTLRVSFINVGQGDCALIKAPGDCDILIDAGGYTRSDSGTNIIAPYLISNGVNDVEYIIISHTDVDHIVGITGLMGNMKIENIIMPYGQQYTELGKAFVETAYENNINILFLTHGDVLKINEEIALTAILPDSGQYMFSKGENDTGIALRLDYGKSSFLFTGDFSSDIEKYAIEKYPDLIEADVLKVAHHGSKYSSCEEFIGAVGAEYAYIPVGRNTYGHPTPEVLERLEKTGTHTYRADLHKDVTFYAISDGIKGVVYNKKIAEE